jgi:hypothetical protein
VLLERVDSLGDAFQPGLAVGDHFAPHRHDGVAVGYDLAFGAACSCYSYHGPRRAMMAS